MTSPEQHVNGRPAEDLGQAFMRGEALPIDDHVLHHERIADARARHMPQPAKLHAHYKKDVSHLQMIDVYRVIDLFQVDHPALQHALKKVLACGKRGAKDRLKDAQEAIDSINRYIEMVHEDRDVAKPFESKI